MSTQISALEDMVIDPYRVVFAENHYTILSHGYQNWSHGNFDVHFLLTERQKRASDPEYNAYVTREITILPFWLEWQCLEPFDWSVVSGTSGTIGVMKYSNDEIRNWKIISECDAVQLVSSRFHTEQCCDFLNIDGEWYSGEINVDQYVPKSTFNIQFTSNENNADGNFTLYWYCAKLKPKIEETENLNFGNGTNGTINDQLMINIMTAAIANGNLRYSSLSCRIYVF